MSRAAIAPLADSEYSSVMIDATILEKEAMQLPAADRAVLADRLIQSLSRTSPELRDAWVKEADSRMKAYRAGKIAAVEGPQAMADLRSRFAE